MYFNQHKLILLGQGKFTRAYRIENSDIVYLFTRTDNAISANNCTKEIYTWLQGYTHIPYMQRVDTEKYIHSLHGNYNIYESRFYQQLTTAYPIAWEQAKVLRAVYTKHLTLHEEKYNYNFHAIINNAYQIAENMAYELEQLIDPVLYDAIYQLIVWSSNYGQNFFMEFNRRNLKIDSDGNLILLDVVYFR